MNYILGLVGPGRRHVGESSRARPPPTTPSTSDPGSASGTAIDPGQGNRSILATPQATIPTGAKIYSPHTSRRPSCQRTGRISNSETDPLPRRPPCQRVLGLSFCPMKSRRSPCQRTVAISCWSERYTNILFMQDQVPVSYT